MSFPGVTEEVLWEKDLVFKIGGKMFTVIGLTESPGLGFKCSPEDFAELIDIPGIRPNKYMARYHWIEMDLADWKSLSSNGISKPRIKELISASFLFVVEKLPKSKKQAIEKQLQRPPKGRN
jgi:predicted DNA-binding protein (MmcQ/YjbR family)